MPESVGSGSLARRSTPALSNGETERVYVVGATSVEARRFPSSVARPFFHQLRDSTLYAGGQARSSCTVIITTCCGPGPRQPRTEHPVAHDEDLSEREEEIPETGAFARKFRVYPDPYDRKKERENPKKRERQRKRLGRVSPSRPAGEDGEFCE